MFWHSLSLFIKPDIYSRNLEQFYQARIFCNEGNIHNLKKIFFITKKKEEERNTVAHFDSMQIRGFRGGGGG